MLGLSLKSEHRLFLLFGCLHWLYKSITPSLCPFLCVFYSVSFFFANRRSCCLLWSSWAFLSASVIITCDYDHVCVHILKNISKWWRSSNEKKTNFFSNLDSGIVSPVVFSIGLKNELQIKGTRLYI